MKNEHILNQVKATTRIRVAGKESTYIVLMFHALTVYALCEATGEIETIKLEDIENVVNTLTHEADTPLPIYASVMIIGEAGHPGVLGYIAKINSVFENGMYRHCFDVVMDKHAVDYIQRYANGNNPDPEKIAQLESLIKYKGLKRDRLVFMDYDPNDMKRLKADNALALVASVRVPAVKQIDSIRERLARMSINRQDERDFLAICDSLDQLNKFIVDNI